MDPRALRAMLKVEQLPPSTERDDLRTELDAALAQRDAATAANDAANITAANDRIDKVSAGADGLAHPPVAPIATGPGWSRLLIGLIIVITAAFLFGVFSYFYALGPARWNSIEATRPILVFTLIVAMLGFGGVLIFRPLLSTEPPSALQERFRLSREVFLVFSGIFGTIIGFYFGAGDRGDAAAGAVPAITKLAVTDKGLTMDVSGGSGSYTVILTLANGKTVIVDGKDGKYAVTLDKAKDCPAGGNISVVDNKGQAAVAAVAEKSDALANAGWTACKSMPNPTPPADNATDTENAVG